MALPNTNTRIPGTWRSDATGAFPRLSTHGSVIGGNVRGAPVELTAGTSGYALVADDTTESGLSWASFAGSNYYVSSIAFNTSTGVLTLGRSGLGDLTQDLDGRYSTLTSPLTTKGDIWVYGSANTRLPVGTDSYALIADSSTATGLNWAANTDANYYTTSASLSAGTLTGVIAGGGSNWTADISAVATGSIASSSQYYNTFYNAATGLVGSAYLQTDGSNNIILSGASNIAKTAADFQSTLGVSGTLTVSGATVIHDTLKVTGNTEIEGTSLLSGNTTITGSLAGTTSANFGTTLEATGNAILGGTVVASGAVTAKSTVDVGSTLTITGATTAKSTLTITGATTAKSNLTVTGTSDLKSTTTVGTGSTTKFTLEPEDQAERILITGTKATTAATEYAYFPYIKLHSDETGGALSQPGYPSIYFTKYGPTSISNPAGDPVGWRIAASGAGGVASAPQT